MEIDWETLIRCSTYICVIYQDRVALQSAGKIWASALFSVHLILQSSHTDIPNHEIRKAAWVTSLVKTKKASLRCFQTRLSIQRLFKYSIIYFYNFTTFTITMEKLIEISYIYFFVIIKDWRKFYHCTIITYINKGK